MYAVTRAVRFPTRWSYLENNGIDRIDAAALSQILKYQRRMYVGNLKSIITQNTIRMLTTLFLLFKKKMTFELKGARWIYQTLRFLCNPSSRVDPYEGFIEIVLECNPMQPRIAERGCISTQGDN